MDAMLLSLLQVGRCIFNDAEKQLRTQNCYNLFVRSGFETDLAEACAKRNCNVGLLAYSPLAGGVLSGKYLNNTAEKGSRLLRFEVSMPALSAECFSNCVLRCI